MHKYHNVWLYCFWFEPKTLNLKSQESDRQTDRQTDGHNSFISNCGNKKLQKDQRQSYLHNSSTKDYFFYKTELIFMIYS